jgi:hypothetical protein
MHLAANASPLLVEPPDRSLEMTRSRPFFATLTGLTLPTLQFPHSPDSSLPTPDSSLLTPHSSLLTMKHSNLPTNLLAKLLLGLGTAPLLAGLIAGKALANFMKEMGQTTEELFRGDRLPVLKIVPKQEEE